MFIKHDECNKNNTNIRNRIHYLFIVTEVLFEYRRGGCDRRAPGNSLSLSVKFDDFFTSTWLLITGFFLLWNIINGLQYVGINILLSVAECQ